MSKIFSEVDRTLMGEFIGFRYKKSILDDNLKQDRETLVKMRTEAHGHLMALLESALKESGGTAITFKYPAQAYDTDEANGISEIPLGFEYKWVTRSSALTSNVLHSVICSDHKWMDYFVAEEGGTKKRETKRKSAQKRRNPDSVVEEEEAPLVQRVFAAYLLSIADEYISSTKPMIRYIKEEAAEDLLMIACPDNIAIVLTSLRDCDAQLLRITTEYESELEEHHTMMMEALQQKSIQVDNDDDLHELLLGLLDRTDRGSINIHTSAENERVKYSISKQESVQCPRPGKRELGSFVIEAINSVWPDGDTPERLQLHLARTSDCEALYTAIENVIVTKKQKVSVKPRTKRLRTTPGDFHIK